MQSAIRCKLPLFSRDVERNALSSGALRFAPRLHNALRFLALAICVLAMFAVGCDHPQIKTYTAPREKPDPNFEPLVGYDLPKGWVRITQPMEMTLAAFKIGDGGKPVLITISRFPGKTGGLGANIERWRGKVGLPPVSEEQMRKELLELPVAGVKMPYVDLVNSKKADADRILGVIAERGPVTWFFKMQGPPDLVSQHKTAFEDFVKSLKFGSTGANDG
jgi:hypothetical protein